MEAGEGWGVVLRSEHANVEKPGTCWNCTSDGNGWWGGNNERGVLFGHALG